MGGDTGRRSASGNGRSGRTAQADAGNRGDSNYFNGRSAGLPESYAPVSDTISRFATDHDMNFDYVTDRATGNLAVTVTVFANTPTRGIAEEVSNVRSTVREITRTLETVWADQLARPIIQGRGSDATEGRVDFVLKPMQ